MCSIYLNPIVSLWRKDKRWALAQYHLNNIIVNHYGRSNMYANTRGGGCSHALESAISLTYLYFIQHSIYSTGQEKRQFLCWGFQLDDTSPLFCLWRGKDKLRHSPSEIFFLFLYQILRYDHFSQQKAPSCLCLPRTLQCTSVQSEPSLISCDTGCSDASTSLRSVGPAHATPRTAQLQLIDIEIMPETSSESWVIMQGHQPSLYFDHISCLRLVFKKTKHLNFKIEYMSSISRINTNSFYCFCFV